MSTSRRNLLAVLLGSTTVAAVAAPVEADGADEPDAVIDGGTP